MPVLSGQRFPAASFAGSAFSSRASPPLARRRRRRRRWGSRQLPGGLLARRRRRRRRLVSENRDSCELRKVPRRSNGRTRGSGIARCASGFSLPRLRDTDHSNVPPFQIGNVEQIVVWYMLGPLAQITGASPARA